jgi:hypothetical protein
MPGVLLEAGALRRPVMATRVGGVSECVLHEKTGLLVEPDDEAGYARLMIDLFRRPDLMRTLGQNANGWIRQAFAMSRIADQYVGFYEQILARRPHQPERPGPTRLAPPTPGGPWDPADAQGRPLTAVLDCEPARSHGAAR